MRVTTRAGVVGGAFAAGLAIALTGNGAASALADSSSTNTSSDPSNSVAASAATSSDPSGPEPSGSGSPKTPAERSGSLFDGTPPTPQGVAARPPKPNSTTRTGKGRQPAAEPDAATPRASAPDAVATVATDTSVKGDTAPVDGDPPTPPASLPGVWTELAFSRREFERSAPPAATHTLTRSAPTEPADLAGPAKPAEPELASPVKPADSVVRTAVATASVPPADPADLRNLYTGQPTFVTQVVKACLQVVSVILRPFGGILAFTSLKIPFVSDGIPPFFATYGLDVTKDDFETIPVWTLQSSAPSGKYVVALHGGAYVAEASVFHWFTYADLARRSGATIVVPDYALIPEGGTAAAAVPVAADLIAQLVREHGAENVSVLGDSAGGGLAVAAVRRLVDGNSAYLPGRMALLAPWLDVTMSDPLSGSIDDPLLTIGELRKDGVLWAGDLDPADPTVSPLFGPLTGLPPTTVFSGSSDLLAADTLRLRDLAAAEGDTNFTFVLRNGLIHDWPIFGFLPEATTIQSAIDTALFG